ncbi:MAG TPA: HAD family phosphatase [Candidatus Omnitrophota bacterium]|nr:HAD family phosphatase [Candidatus Omnitrophota bacterium]
MKKDKSHIKAIVFDIDGTITRHISSWRYIHEKLGLWDVLAKKYQEQFLSGKISYRKFCELDAAHWKGLDAGQLHDLFRNVKYSVNAKKVLRKLKKDNYKLIAISTGLQFITDRVKADMAFDRVEGNRLLVRKGKLTGAVEINIGHGEKGKTLKKILTAMKIKPRETVVVGDSEGDIPMIRLAGYAIAFNSTSEELSAIVNYSCRTKDFNEIYLKIKEIAQYGK